MSATQAPSPTSGIARVRPATAGDVPALLAMMRELAALEGASAHLLADAATLLRDGFGPEPRFHALLAEVDDRAVGYLSYTTGYSIWAATTLVAMDDLYVAERHRGSGIGQRLMDALAALATRQGHGLARWTVESDNAGAIRFYERLGARVRHKGVCTWTPGAQTHNPSATEER